MMNTIEIQSEDKIKNYRLIKSIYKRLNGDYFHYFYEPKLIIRVYDPSVGMIVRYLIKRKIKYSLYPYPFVKKGYGVGKRAIDAKYSVFFNKLYFLYSGLAMKRMVKEDYKIIERITHCWANIFGYEWIDEVLYWLHLSIGRLRLVKKYETSTMVSKLYCSFIIGILHFTYKLIYLLKS